MQRLLRILLLLSCGAVANAAAIDVSYTATGAPGAWNLDFTVTNNMTAWPAQDIYRFGVLLSTSNVVASPGNFLPDSTAWTNFFFGGSSLFYNNTWYDGTFSGLFPGTSVSSFVAGIADVAPPTQVAWFAYSATTTSDPADAYTGNEAFYNDPDLGNAGFEGIASPVSAATPEPASFFLVSGAVGAIIALRRLRPAGSKS
jgi:hypothetical protein